MAKEELEKYILILAPSPSAEGGRDRKQNDNQGRSSKRGPAQAERMDR